MRHEKHARIASGYRQIRPVKLLGSLIFPAHQSEKFDLGRSGLGGPCSAALGLLDL
jgi:hypothetical protein